MSIGLYELHRRVSPIRLPRMQNTAQSLFYPSRVKQARGLISQDKAIHIRVFP